MTSEESIFQFKDYRDYLKVVGKQSVSRRLELATLDRWVKKLGYKSPRSIAMVLKGQRLPSATMIERLSQCLGHDEIQHRYFELLIHLQKTRQKGGDPRLVLEALQRLRPSMVFPNIDANKFAFIADWYHFVIKQLIDAPAFRNDPNIIRKALRNKVTIAEIKDSIAMMLEMGVLAKDRKGKLHVVTENIYTNEGDPDEALKKHHCGMIARALDALEELQVSHREVTSLTFRVDKDKTSKLIGEIRKFRDDINKRYSSDKADGVYQLNFQFFAHTKQRESTNGK